MQHELEDVNSSLIKRIFYDDDEMELTVDFRNHYPAETLIHINVPYETVMEFLNSSSQGNYYLEHIKPLFKTKKRSEMSDTTTTQKTETIWIDQSIDVTKVNKDWLQIADKPAKDGHIPIYLNIKVGYKPDGDQFGNNGMVVQKVPTDVWKEDKTTKSPILGNAKVWKKEPADNHVPGADTGISFAEKEQDYIDDLPF